MGDGPRYASVEGARVAYEVHEGGRGPDIVYSPGLASHLDMTYEQPRYRRYIEALCRFGRVIRFDRRGTGISDPAPGTSAESWETWADDLGAVLDAAQSDEAAVIATNDAGPAAMLFAASHPERVRTLVLFNTTARFKAADDYPAGHPEGVAELVIGALGSTWGTEDSVGLLAPSLAADEPFRRWYVRFQRAAGSPSTTAENIARVLQMDARHVLPTIQCPTLVIHRSEYGTLPASHGRYLAEHIPNGVYLEVPGADAPIYTQGMDEMVEAIGSFMGAAPGERSDDRQFSTVLFTDIVSSTRLAATMGDRAWHQTLDDHDAALRAAVLAHGGRYIKSTGDGALATFDAASRGIRCAQAIRAGVQPLGLDVRAGLHAGPVVVRQDGDVGGLAVHAAARVLSCAGSGEVWVSASVAKLVADPDLAFRDQGSFDLKGIPGAQQLLSVVPAAG